MPKIKNRLGIQYGRLIVIAFAGQNKSNRIFWLCKCDCGKEIIVQGSNLQSGHTKSCGCFNREIVSRTMSKRIGKNNPGYKNGKDCGKYTKEIFELKEKKRKENNYTCQNCGKTQEQNLKELGRKLDIHHIDNDDTNNDSNNLVTLCKSCHSLLK